MAYKKPIVQTLRERYVKSPKRVIAIVAVVTLVVCILIDLSPLGGNMKFYVKWIQCGEKPVIAFGPGFRKGLPGYYEQQPAVSISRGYGPFFCTPLEAEQAGYSADPNSRSFPHLNKT